jgi:hypothetical protein
MGQQIIHLFQNCNFGSASPILQQENKFQVNTEENIRKIALKLCRNPYVFHIRICTNSHLSNGSGFGSGSNNRPSIEININKLSAREIS